MLYVIVFKTLLRYYVFDNLAKTVKTASGAKELLKVDTHVTLYYHGNTTAGNNTFIKRKEGERQTERQTEREWEWERGSSKHCWKVGER